MRGGNLHPGFMGWVQGGGTVAGMLAEMLAGGLNANLGGRDHSAIAGRTAAGALGARDVRLSAKRRRICLSPAPRLPISWPCWWRGAARWDLACGRRDWAGRARPCAAYTSGAAHLCVRRAFDMAGLGTDALQPGRAWMPTNASILPICGRAFAPTALPALTPFLVVGSAGTVDVGAIDDLAALAALCAEEKLWFHVDGAFGALGVLSPEIAPRLAGIEQADSIAFDFHKWGQVPYDAGFLLVREAAGAARYLRVTRRLSGARGARHGRRHTLALRYGSRPVARLSGAEDLVHPQDLWRRPAGRDDGRELPLWRAISRRGSWPSRSWSCWRRRN